MNLDIKTAVQTLFYIFLAGGLYCIIAGVNAIRSGKKLLFFRKRHDLMVKGWRFLFLAIFLGIMAFVFNRFAEPTVYRVFPPSPTITRTPTVSLTPSITLIPSITLTPTMTYTPLVSPTPFIPSEIQQEFSAVKTPDAESIFSKPIFSRKINENQPVDPVIEFRQPLSVIYGAFSYDKMLDGSQWTAIWYQKGRIICYETKPWDGGTGGYGFTECTLPPEEWIPGTYEVQIFIGLDWVSASQFTVVGEPFTPTVEKPTPSPTTTQTPTVLIPTRTMQYMIPTNTPVPSRTPRVSDTKWPTLTKRPLATDTLWPTHIKAFQYPPSATDTLWPTLTKFLTSTLVPTRTPLITDTLWPTLTFVPTETRWPTLTPRPIMTP